jgi:hypothetical protein
MEIRKGILLVYTLLIFPPITDTIKAQGKYGTQLPEGTIISITSRKGYLYAGIDNYLQVNQSLISECDTLLIAASNGTILFDTLNMFVLFPDRVGSMRLTIQCMKNSDTLITGYCYFTVFNVPDPVLTLNDQPIGSPLSISKASFLSSDSLGVYFGNDIYGSEKWIRITDFTIGYNYGGFHISHVNNSNKISAKTKEIISNLGPDHEISILISVKTEGNVQKQLPIYMISLY